MAAPARRGRGAHARDSRILAAGSRACRLHQRKNLLAGCIVVAVLVLLTVSGYVLYYSDEETRPVVSMLHWIIGRGAPVVLVWHIVSGRGTRSTADR